MARKIYDEEFTPKEVDINLGDILVIGYDGELEHYLVSRQGDNLVQLTHLTDGNTFSNDFIHRDDLPKTKNLSEFAILMGIDDGHYIKDHIPYNKFNIKIERIGE